MKIIKKSGDILGGILMVVSLILLIPLFLTNMGINSYIILSGSMEPVIRTGSMVLVDNQTEDIQMGDIIMYRLQKENVVHRVVEIQEDGKIITKGDNNENADFAPVTQAQVCGKVIKMPWGLCIPYAGYVSEWLSTNKIYVVCVMFGLVIIPLLLLHLAK